MEKDGVRTSGWIVETEAYVGVDDQASHSFNGKNTPRMQMMFEEPGRIYIYQMHTHHMLNVVTKEKGNPQAVLIRAIEPFEGQELLEERRQKKGVEATNGPGKLTKAMGIKMDAHGGHIDTPPLFIEFESKRHPAIIESTSRIGIPNKGQWTEALLRYTVKGNPYVSRKRGQIDANYGWKATL